MKGSVDMKRFDLIIVGAGPSGLSAAIEAAKRGLEVVVFDENEKPGGQLFKQIHKFFGSKEHKAKIRGFKIGEDLLKEADAAGVKVVLNATGLVLTGGHLRHFLTSHHFQYGRCLQEQLHQCLSLPDNRLWHYL